jgi:hypothetical protein
VGNARWILGNERISMITIVRCRGRLTGSCGDGLLICVDACKGKSVRSVLREFDSRPQMKYDYGDEVILHRETGNATATKPGAIVGITEVLSDKQAEVLGYPIGTVVYTVEFGDGSDQLVPESDLLPLGTEI